MLYRLAKRLTPLITLNVFLTSFIWQECGAKESDSTAFLNKYCGDCHSETEPEADLDLTKLSVLSKSNSEAWQRVLTQLASGEMPPEGEVKPSIAEREATIAAITASLSAAGVQPKLPGGPLPEDGNWIDHERLFSGHFHGPASSPPRFWRRSQSQYDSLMEQLRIIPKLRYEKSHTRNNPEWAAYSYSQPFPALDPGHFTNYASSVHADEAALRSLLDAGGQIAIRLTSNDVAYAKQLQPPIAVGVPSIKRGSTWEKWKVEPPPLFVEFEPFIAEDAEPTIAEQDAAVMRVFELFLGRGANDDELKRYGGLLKRSMTKNGSLAALRGLITAVIVSPEFVFRMEVGMSSPDEHGRRMLSSQELVYAISYALSDDGPDDTLRVAANSGKLKTKADVEREVRRILADDSIEKHRKLRFFQEFFGYHRAIEVFKDKPGWQHEVQYLVRDADLFVEHILDSDQDVFRKLLTADRYFVAFPKIDDPTLFDAIIEKTIEEAKSSIERTKQRGKKIEPSRAGGYNRAWSYSQGYELIPRTVHNDRGSSEMSYISIYGIDGATFQWTRKQPIEVPGRRAGILTHPAWLVAHSTNFDNDVVGRGHWVRENLLAGKIPDVPIDVEAKVPDEPDSTLRHRMRVTQEAKCLRCHRRMDPLGFPFEIYDHYGRYREQEMVGARDNIAKPIDASGAILSSGEGEIDGEVEDAIELTHRLAKSSRVRQSIIRHAFRYWVGRNEMLGDSPTLIEADEAYLKSGGSLNEVLVSLLTSDSFLYRK